MTSSADSLGEVQCVFRPKKANIIAGVIIGLLLILGGISAATLIAVQRDPPHQALGDKIGKYVCIGLLGILLPAGGIPLLLWMKRLASHRVVIFEHGFSYGYVDHAEICPWADIEKVDEVFTKEELKILKLPGASLKNIDRSFVVHRKDGKEFPFSVNTVDSIPRLIECFEKAREKHDFPWQQIQQ